MNIEMYRGWEITACTSGYGYFATQPDFDLGMPCFAETSVEKCKREVDQWIEDNSDDEPVNLLDAVRANAANLKTRARERLEYEDPYGHERNRRW